MCKDDRRKDASDRSLRVLAPIKATQTALKNITADFMVSKL